MAQRTVLNSAVRYQVLMRDGRQCTHVFHTGERCLERKNLEVHHVVEVSRGGQDSLENLATLCGFHHQMRHPRFVISSQDLYRERARSGRWIREPQKPYAVS